MGSFVRSVYGAAELGVVKELPGAGTDLENPFVYDAAARELKALASQGLVKIVEESRSPTALGNLINRVCFERLR